MRTAMDICIAMSYTYYGRRERKSNPTQQTTNSVCVWSLLTLCAKCLRFTGTSALKSDKCIDKFSQTGKPPNLESTDGYVDPIAPFL